LHSYGPRLWSMAAHEWWEPGKPMEGDPTIAMYGVHAFKSILEAARQYRGSRNPLPTAQWDMCVFGRIALWGDIYEHDRGYRAQYGRPIEFTELDPPDHPEAEEIMSRLRETYLKDLPDGGDPEVSGEGI